MLAISGSKGCHLAYRRLASEKWARVHFILNLKVGVFLTLCAPDVIIISRPKRSEVKKR
jgi:hypothetical protein